MAGQYMFSAEQRIFIYESYVLTQSARQVQIQFKERFPGIKIPGRTTIHALYKKFQATGSVMAKKPHRPRRVLTEETLADISYHLVNSPNKSIRCLVQETGISYGSIQRGKRLLNLKPDKVIMPHDLHPGDAVHRRTFCEWILNNVHNREIDPHLIFFSDEVWFHLNGYVCSQSYCFWSTEDSDIVQEVPLHDEKIGVWCAMSGERIVAAMFYDTELYAETYINTILPTFLKELTERERKFAFFQQETATSYTANISIKDIEGVFQDRVISKNLWPPRSSDLTPCNFYLWDSLKDKVYRTNPHTVEELKHNICQEIASISQQELRQVMGTFLKRCQKCVEKEGGHFEHLL